MEKHVKVILQELSRVLVELDYEAIDPFEESLLQAEIIVGAGAGRVGLATAGFTKRLMHLGKSAHWFLDETLPRAGKGGTLLVASGSGETRTMIGLAEIAKSSGLDIAAVTAEPDSTLARLSDRCVVLRCPNKARPDWPFKSRQPMTTLFEQSLGVFFDAMVLDLMVKMNVTESDMSARHNVIE